MTNNHSNARFLELDILRGLSAFAVVAYHYIFQYVKTFDAAVPSALMVSVPSVPNEYLGLIPVFIFFMISGFVITWSVERSTSGRNFAFSRFTRLFPAYWLAVILTSTVVWLSPLPSGFSQPSMITWLINMTMLQSFLGVSDIDGVYWSLGVELVFYVWIFAWRQYLWPRSIVPALWVVMCLSLAYGLFDAKSNPIPWPVVKLLMLDHVHFFVIGIIAYRVWSQKTELRSELPLIAMILVAIAQRYPWAVGVILAIALVTFMLLATRRLGWITLTPLAWLGSISYPLYLTHQNIGYVAFQYLHFTPEVELVIVTTMSLALATFITIAIERPAMRALREWRKGHAASSP